MALRPTSSCDYPRDYILDGRSTHSMSPAVRKFCLMFPSHSIDTAMSSSLAPRLDTSVIHGRLYCSCEIETPGSLSVLSDPLFSSFSQLIPSFSIFAVPDIPWTLASHTDISLFSDMYMDTFFFCNAWPHTGNASDGFCFSLSLDILLMSTCCLVIPLDDTLYFWTLTFFYLTRIIDFTFSCYIDKIRVRVPGPASTVQ